MHNALYCLAPFINPSAATPTPQSPRRRRCSERTTSPGQALHPPKPPACTNTRVPPGLPTPRPSFMTATTPTPQHPRIRFPDVGIEGSLFPLAEPRGQDPEAHGGPPSPTGGGTTSGRRYRCRRRRSLQERGRAQGAPRRGRRSRRHNPPEPARSRQGIRRLRPCQGGLLASARRELQGPRPAEILHQAAQRAHPRWGRCRRMVRYHYFFVRESTR